LKIDFCIKFPASPGFPESGNPVNLTALTSFKTDTSTQNQILHEAQSSKIAPLESSKRRPKNVYTGQFFNLCKILILRQYYFRPYSPSLDHNGNTTTKADIQTESRSPATKTFAPISSHLISLGITRIVSLSPAP